MMRYRGTCIGGVADGHWIERDDAEIQIQARRKTANPFMDAPQGTAPEEIILQSTNYKFLLLLGTTNEEIGVWVPTGVPPIQATETVLKRLIQCYNPRTGLIGQPAPNKFPLKN